MDASIFMAACIYIYMLYNKTVISVVNANNVCGDREKRFSVTIIVIWLNHEEEISFDANQLNARESRGYTEK